MKKIQFIPSTKLTERIVEPPQPSIKILPNWYKKIGFHIDKNIKNHRRPSGQSNLTAKSCVPIFDAMSAGYLITLPCDVSFVDPEKYGYRVVWEVSWLTIGSHSHDQVQGMVPSEDFEPDPLRFEGLWRIKTPKNYSLLYTHPFYRFDLPFLSTTAIVDSDIYDTALNIPFFIKKDFFGILEKGTPIAQVIPIKRDSWKSEVLEYDSNYEHDLQKVTLNLVKSYKKNFWQKKSYK